MVKKFSANISNWFKKKLGSTASQIKMNGTQSAGTSENVAREDHVHPVDTSRAASSHTHGNITNAGAIGSAANKPVITTTSGKLTTGDFESTATNIKMNGTQAVGTQNTFARGDHVHPTDTSRASTAAVTQSANGLMSKEDKTKLDKSMSISAGNVGGTTSAYTVSLTGVTLTHGTLIALYNAIGANAASATLNVNSLGAKPIYYNASAITAGRYPNKSTCIFMYNTSIVSTGCWQLIYSYDSNTTYTADTLKDATAHTEAINTAANATQTSINSALDSAIKEVDERCDDIVAGDIDLSSTHTHTKSQITDFPTSMTPSSHAHGNISNDGVISGQASKNVVTDANGKITTEAKPTIPSANSTATNIKMDGTQSAGSLSTFAKADHVHPVDTSRAASSHTHGSLANGGTLNSDITSVNKVAVTDSSNNLKTISKVPFANLNITKDNITGLGIPASDTNTTYSAVTQSANGLAISTDKAKLDKSMVVG
ncbi:MAG: hypothetical protein IJQ68_10265, partial [Methanobrevibacter sp.]|uniref:hypothetical protein n=1 Tax=Methanobrevibacter sp. TaxID=66852 RepID=UPI0025D6DD50